MSGKSVWVMDVRHECQLCEDHAMQGSRVGLCICGREQGRFMTYHNGLELHHGFIGPNCFPFVDLFYRGPKA